MVNIGNIWCNTISNGDDKLMGDCGTCLGYGLHALGEHTPIGELDSKSLPTMKCPECGKGEKRNFNVLRKGQHLFNEIEKIHGSTLLREGRLHKILFYMPDKEFDQIMRSIK